jgi:DNA-directed RNA polymerase subunit K/omega
MPEACRTTNYLTKFEFTRLVGLRVLQLSSQGTSTEDPQTVALREILRGENPSVVRRKLPDGRWEDRAVAALRLPESLRRMCEDGLKI